MSDAIIIMFVLLNFLCHLMLLSAIQIVVTLNNINEELQEAVNFNFSIHYDNIDNQVSLFCASKYLDARSCQVVRDHAYTQISPSIVNEYKSKANRLSTIPIRSFDIFDTILARQVFNPTDIFALVEKRYPFPNFVTLRQQVLNIVNALPW